MLSWLKEFWLGCVRAAQLLMLIRVPLLMVLIGAWLTLNVEQIAELFALSVQQPRLAWMAWLGSATCGLCVWFSARTLYAFDWHALKTDLPRSESWACIGEQLPRWLATLVPLTMATGYHDVGPHWGFVAAFLAQAVALFVFTWKRRPWSRPVLERLQVPERFLPELHPVVGKLRSWKALPRATRWTHAAGIGVLLLAGIVGSWFPEWIEHFGPLALILLAATWTVWASTLPVYWATRARLPLLTAVLFAAVAISWGFPNDNHAVRTRPGMASTERATAPADAPDRVALDSFVDRWLATHDAQACPQVYLVSSEGGGIRAAMWTAQVLAALEAQSPGPAPGRRSFWDCTLAASGVSGGSLGLAVFAAAMRDGAEPADVVALLEVDFLATVLGRMFGSDPLQRFLPVALFADRSQALEDRWIRAYESKLGAQAGSFVGPLTELLHARDDAHTPRTALLLNTTVVQSGQRLVQHPFAPFDCGNGAGGPLDPLACRFPGALDGARWFPATLPVSSAALNSARFPYVSAAGSVRIRDPQGKVVLLGQLVDGGYFENSASATLADFLRRVGPRLQRRERVLHISNDPGVPALMADGADRCEPQAAPLEVASVGGLLAPPTALVRTRDGRGEQARRALAHESEPGFVHFRLCRGAQRLPLGWSLSAATRVEMQAQLDGTAAVRARGFPGLRQRALTPNP